MEYAKMIKNRKEFHEKTAERLIAKHGPVGSSYGDKPARSPFYKELGERIKACRKARGLSQKQLGKLLGYGSGIMSKAENGLHAMPLHTFVHFKTILTELEMPNE
jgi:ribosome-binding protein aMBF1 (putative translation factor)